MNRAAYGGNVVSEVDLGAEGRQLLAAGPYEYALYQSRPNEDIDIHDLGSFTVYVLDADPAARVTVAALGTSLERGDAIQVEAQPLTLSVTGGRARFLIAGTRVRHFDVSRMQLTRAADQYKVSKPWGHELWINGQHPGYALKQVALKAGRRTSLQYHHVKHETNVLFEGTMALHYKANGSTPNDEVTADETAVVRLGPVSSIVVAPPTLHRIEALSDVVLYETSTPHLDDVVRVHDDSLRPHGRIDAEHQR